MRRAYTTWPWNGRRESPLAGPKLAGGLGRWETGTTHTLVFAKAGVYRLQAVNVQSSAEMGLQTLGLDAKPLLIVRVR